MTESQWPAVTNKITFHSNKIYNKKDRTHAPSPMSKSLATWWQDASIYIKDPNGNPYINPDGITKVMSYKSCPALLDIFTTGYALLTPCDIEFYEKRGRTKVKTDVGFEDFVGERAKMEGFVTPAGYDDDHFHWYANWAPVLPEGYSAIYLSPVNRFDLPFLTVAGIIDSDKVTNSGLIPFFLQKGFTGVVPAGTPYMQIIPFKRDDWEMDLVFRTAEEILQKHKETADTFRSPDGGVYKKKFWSKRKYQ